jgi:hypothetical protein
MEKNMHDLSKMAISIFNFNFRKRNMISDKEGFFLMT